MASELVIYPLCVGMFGGPLDRAVTDRGPFVSAMFVFLVVGGKVPILVDTGTLDPMSARIRQHRVLHRPPELDPVAAVQSAGIAPDEIGIIINTHLHWDHASNNDRFPRAKIYVQRKEVAHAVDPLKEHAPFYDKLPGVQPSWLRAWDRIEAIEGDRELAPGVTIVALPGHSPGSQGVLVETKVGRFLLAGDNVNSYADWEARTPPRVIVSESDWWRSVRRIEMLDCTVIPSHDLELIKQPVFGM